MTNQTHRVALATDIPFWNNANGAQQRMSALWRMFGHPPFEIVVFYLGSPKDEILSAARAKGVVLWPFEHNRMPKLLSNLLAKLSGKYKSKSTSDASPPDELTLHDYRWQDAERQFRDFLRQFRPNTVVLEYVTMAYLADVARPVVPAATIVLDSHDVLHRRCAQFKAAGYRHWLQIDETEESAAVRKFDVILAIQDDEAAWFRRAAPRAKVLTVGHGFDFGQISPGWNYHPSRQLVVGYFGSNNSSNVDAVTNFVRSVWPRVLAANPQVALLIAGTIADASQVAPFGTAPHVRLERSIASPAAFYHAVDVVINPVRFGTGLKIKTVEALAHGRPVVTTMSGKVGVPDAFGNACTAVDDQQEMASALIALLSNPEALLRLSQTAFELAKIELAESKVMGEFRRLLLEETEPAAPELPALGNKNA